MESTSGKAVSAALNACMPNLASTPAKSAAAISCGILSITRSNQPVTPARKISAALTMKAPTASPMVNPPMAPAVASTAAPGVDQATITGFLRIREGTSEHSPMPMPSAHIHEAISAGVAPKA